MRTARVLTFEFGDDGACGFEISFQALQIGAKFGGALIAQVPVFFESVADDLFELRRNIGIETDGRDGSAVEYGICDQCRSIAAEGHRARGHFVQHSAERIKIRARVQFLGRELLGRHIRDGSDGCAGTGEVLRAHGRNRVRRERVLRGYGFVSRSEFRQTKIENFRVAAFGDENVGGLDVAVNDAFFVRGFETVHNLDR